MNKTVLIILSVILIAGVGIYIFDKEPASNPNQVLSENTIQTDSEDAAGLTGDELHPLSIEKLRQGEYPGSDIVIEQTLTPGSNYDRFIASYKSEGLKIYALLTIPNGPKPPSGWPVIVFNHGYIAPTQYKTTEKYIAYTDAFSRNGYIVFKSDYRGHGNSEGSATGSYGSSGYTIDVLNAVASLKKYPDVDSSRIGMWGHSMGGHITLRNMVVRPDIKAGVIWAGVVASYPDLLNNWRRRQSTPPPGPPAGGSIGARRWRDELVSEYGPPEANPEFWNSISANSFLSDISGPLQLHHGTADTSVPIEFSEKLSQQAKTAGKPTEIYTYPGDDHNLSANFNSAIQRSVTFFDQHLKKQ